MSELVAFFRACKQVAERNREFTPPRPLMLAPELVEKLKEQATPAARNSPHPHCFGQPVYEVPEDGRVYVFDGYAAINRDGTVYTWPVSLFQQDSRGLLPNPWIDRIKEEFGHVSDE